MLNDPPLRSLTLALSTPKPVRKTERSPAAPAVRPISLPKPAPALSAPKAMPKAAPIAPAFAAPKPAPPPAPPAPALPSAALIKAMSAQRQGATAQPVNNYVVTFNIDGAQDERQIVRTIDRHPGALAHAQRGALHD